MMQVLLLTSLVDETIAELLAVRFYNIANAVIGC